MYMYIHIHARPLIVVILFDVSRKKNSVQNKGLLLEFRVLVGIGRLRKPRRKILLCFHLLIQTPWEAMITKNYIKLWFLCGIRHPWLRKHSLYLACDVPLCCQEVCRLARWIADSASCSGYSEGYHWRSLRVSRTVFEWYLGGCLETRL